MWLYAKFLVPQSQPLAGAPDTTALTRVNNKEHYTNIYRVGFLARQHPLVDSVGFHKLKGHKFALDATGGAIRFHQSPWDLLLTLAASGAKMFVGVSVHKTHSDLLSLWRRPLTEMNEEQATYALDVFLDIMEAMHYVPDSCTTRRPLAATKSKPFRCCMSLRSAWT